MSDRFTLKERIRMQNWENSWDWNQSVWWLRNVD